MKQRLQLNPTKSRKTLWHLSTAVLGAAGTRAMLYVQWVDFETNGLDALFEARRYQNKWKNRDMGADTTRFTYGPGTTGSHANSKTERNQKSKRCHRSSIKVKHYFVFSNDGMPYPYSCSRLDTCRPSRGQALPGSPIHKTQKSCRPDTCRLSNVT